MAPWFEEQCKEAKYNYKQLKRTHGKKQAIVKEAYKEYKTICKK